MRAPEKTGRKQDGTFDQGFSGNPAGRPKGSLNGTTLAAQQLLKGEAEKLTRKAIQLALDGDLAALRICLERVLPKRQPSIQIELGPLEEVDHLRAAFGGVLAAMANGQISATELTSLNALLDAHMKFFELVEFEKRLNALEETIARAHQEV